MFKYIVRSIIKQLTRLVNEPDPVIFEYKPSFIKPINKIKLEPTNFRVSSEGWIKKTIGSNSVNFKDTLDVLISPCGGIIEFLYDERFPNLHNEQLFKWDAAMEAVKKANRRMPSEEQFEVLEKKDLGDIKYVGYIGYSEYFWYQNLRAYFWTSTVAYSNDDDTTINNYCLEYDEHESFMDVSKNNLYYSVRCIDPTSAYDS